jgi:hypothetical protein
VAGACESRPFFQACECREPRARHAVPLRSWHHVFHTDSHGGWARCALWDVARLQLAARFARRRETVPQARAWGWPCDRITVSASSDPALADRAQFLLRERVAGLQPCRTLGAAPCALTGDADEHISATVV